MMEQYRKQVVINKSWEEQKIWDMICIFRQESKKREQDGLSPVAIAMITAQRMIQVFLTYAGGAEARNVM